MKILFYTFHDGHLVSDKEYGRMAAGLAKIGISLIKAHKEVDVIDDYDLIMVKGWSHTWEEIKARNPNNKPVIYLSIGTEWKSGVDLKELNEPIREMYEKANATVHISEYCKQSHDKVFGKTAKNEYVIIPACEPNLPKEYPKKEGKLKLATTCIPRPVKRVEETERLCEKFGVELVKAYGSVTDFSYYHDCHGYIHLSRKEGMPNTVLEAMSYGLPCIVTNYGGAKEAVGSSGIVINNDPQDVAWDPSNIQPIDDFLFVDALEKLTQNLDFLRLKVRQRVLSELNDTVMAEKFNEVFQSCLK